MNIVDRKDIDDKKWNNLVVNTKGASIFSHTSYLDSVAEHWCALVDDNYTSGMALPYSIRLGVKGLYTPNFSRYLEWLCLDKENDKKPSDLFEQLRFYFKIAAFNSSFLINENYKTVFVYQINDGLKEYNKLSNRMLKKYNKSDYSIKNSTQINKITRFINDNLSLKAPNLSPIDYRRFDTLVLSLQQHDLLTAKAVYDKNDQIQGGCFFVEQNDSILYLKGAACQDAQNEGAMYALINEGILLAKSKNKTFDYGGSRIPGVRQFFMNIGGYDKKYYFYQWNKSPLPVKTAHYLNRLLLKKKK